MKLNRARYRINFLQQVNEYNNYGEPISKWRVYKTAWASKDPLLGNEYFTANTTDSKVEVKFNSRYIPGIKNEMRIQCGDEIYKILSAINVKSMNRELLCYCKLVN